MSIIEQARIELAAINFGEEDTAVMIGILEKFFDQWDSRGAVSVVVPVLIRLLNGQPLSPLTGADSEWFIHDIDGMYAQNIRCSTVFKATKDGPAYDIDVPGRPPITFPYDPATRLPSEPVLEFKTGTAGLPWDHPYNRSYEPVERRAAERYALFAYDGPGERPTWVPGGNSIKQDEAREQARAELRAVGHRA